MGKLEIKISKIDKLKKIFLYVKHNNEDNKETKKKWSQKYKCTRKRWNKRKHDDKKQNPKTHRVNRGSKIRKVEKTTYVNPDLERDSNDETDT